MAKYTLVIDPGHGGKDPGTIKGTRREKDSTLKISLYQFKRFKQLGVSCALTRDSDITLTEDERVRRVKEGKYCLSNHLNGGGADRGEVIHSIYDDGKLAHKIKDALISAGQTAMKVYFRKSGNFDYYYMHRRTGATITNIVEYCFNDNEADFKHFNDNWEAYAEAVVRAFCQHIGHNYIPPAQPQVQPKPQTKELDELNETGRQSARNIIRKAVAEGLFHDKHVNVDKYSDKDLISYVFAYIDRKK